jgi:hypothetical protein
VVNFTPWTLHPQGKNPKTCLEDMQKKKFMTLPGFEL